MRAAKLSTGFRRHEETMSERPVCRFITFEGIDGCGKSTLLEQLGNWLEAAGIAYVKTREPGGTRIGEKIRGLLLDPENKSMDDLVELFLYTASRAQHVQEVIRPALEKGIWVLSDRFTDATLAYQGYGRGLDLEMLQKIQNWATRGLWPDHTILLDCDVQVASERMRGRNAKADRMEQQNLIFHQRVRAGYLELAKREPQRFLVLDGRKDLEQVVDEFHAAFWKPMIESS